MGELSTCHNLGNAYASGIAVKQDFVKAAQLLEKACTGGITPSCTNLGDIYLDGAPGIKRDRRKAAALWKQACSAGSQPACNNLTEMKGGTVL